MKEAGVALIALTWVSGLWGAVALWEARRGEPFWERAGKVSWVLHLLALAGTLGLLLYMLLAHRFEYHYAWAHGSRLLPTAYVLAALWEGQEGSFLLWMFWHAVFSVGLWLTRDSQRRSITAGLLLTNAYFATFLLGIQMSAWVWLLVGSFVWLVWAAEGMPWLHRVVGLGLLAGIWMAGHPWLRGIGVFWIAGAAFYWRWLPIRAAVGAVALLLLPSEERWGSLPFLYLWEVRSDVAVGTIPPDGNGLNPLLQSFWMVIHPPVLFSGYAAAALPFWEGLLAAREGKLTMERSRRLLRFLWIAVSLLGMGIALGAFWAYETLNFGGYWNWDPVENASLAPWLILVAAAHMLWVWRRHKKGETIALSLSLLGWPLVLYSSYLTRSGVLSDSSVHSFTDLGLGSLLLWGTGTSLVALLLAQRSSFSGLSSSLPKVSLTWGILLMSWITLVLLVLTSLPALNRLLGTAWALGSGALQVYYEWIGVFAVPMLGLMGFALVESFRLKGWNAILWGTGAFLLGTVGLLWWLGWDFVYHPSYRTLLEQSWLDRLRASLFLLLDDLLLGGALVGVGAALALLTQRKSPSSWGAGIAHLGFALLIIGALFSSGYQKTLSQNLSPHSPAAADNLFLPLGGKASALGYMVEYHGLLRPVPPLQILRPILHEKGLTLWRFVDSLGYAYQLWLPDSFPKGKGIFHPVSQPSLLPWIERNLFLLPVIPADNRYRYFVRLTDLDKNSVYPLYLEADLSQNSGLLAHPSHIRFWHGDLYIHLTSVPQPTASMAMQQLLLLSLGDTAEWDGLYVHFYKLTEIEDAPHPTFRAWLRLWRTLPETARILPVEFSLQEKELLTPPASLVEWGIGVQLEDILIQERKLRFRLSQVPQPDRFITIKILYKPFIGLLWGGIGLMLVGTLIAVWRHRSH
ncbi:MAG: cytochrome c biogenesis protein CcsA [Bacteroidia bacterium]|nr:cytochrome c biogenesis protein CcsA [Bacteroidia bacterium]MDW8236073.1 cytochrome c biogenesis protein CcsA [Bacteroidia bacterium]